MSVVTLDTRDRVLAGILFTSLAYFLFTVHDAVVKLLVVAIPVWQVLFFRSLTILAGCLVVGGRPLFADAARSPIFKPMFLRSFLIMAAWLCFYTAARSLQLAELTTIYYAAPIIVTVLSVLVLKEKVPLARWGAVAIGFLGVFIACDPSNLGLSLPVLLVLAAASMWGLAIVLMRKIAQKDRSIVQMVLSNSFFLVTTGLPLVYLWHTPSLREIALLIGSGVLAGFAQFALFEGMKRAPASVIAPFEYTAVVWSFLLGYLIWHDLPRNEVFVGAALIVGAGLIIVASEHFRRHP
jgi:drug/metabolite transporter (DMT)-like permease